MIEKTEALWAAKLHVRTSVGGTPGTLLSTEMVLAICNTLNDLDAQLSTRDSFTPGALVAICTCAASPNRLPHQRDEHCRLFTNGITVTP